jgi:hypothetical protein
VETRYKKTKEAEPLKKARAFIYIKPNSRKETFYFYNTKDTKFKFSHKFINKETFMNACDELKAFA